MQVDGWHPSHLPIVHPHTSHSPCPTSPAKHSVSTTEPPAPTAVASLTPRSLVVGVGSTKFDKPRGLREYDSLGLEAAVKALLDAGLSYDSVETAAVGYVYGDSTCGQRCLYQLGMTGIPIVNGACARQLYN